jgi:hypothetical protein
LRPAFPRGCDVRVDLIGGKLIEAGLAGALRYGLQDEGPNADRSPAA